jgi:chaperonin GroEL
VVPGAGMAYLACRSALQSRLRQAEDDDQRAALSILLKALEAPARTILENAGIDSRDALAEARQAGPGYGYDINARRVVDMSQAGICDSAAVSREALFSAVHGAALVLTTDVLVHRRIRPESIATTG